MEMSWLETLGLETCLAHLRAVEVGRLAIVAADGGPIVLPVNFRLVEMAGVPWIALRTRPGSALDDAGATVAFEVDSIDPAHHRGWSVLVRGTLLRVEPGAATRHERFDSDPWLMADRDAWLAIEPFSISGRELHPAQPDWAFHVEAYL
jgi:nitroimidazol reductase NimA-like FMN-containing flavoprotein (pyridoxamine 5'-phosphate oxidase superfamily)